MSPDERRRIFEVTEGRIEGLPVDGISATGDYSEIVAAAQRAFIKGFRLGRLATLNTVMSISRSDSDGFGGA